MGIKPEGNEWNLNIMQNWNEGGKSISKVQESQLLGGNFKK